MTEQTPPPANYNHSPQFSTNFADYLELEASLSEPVISAALEAVVTELGREPHSVLDLGAGAGAGSLAIAHRFRRARVTSFDISSELLGRLTTRAKDSGVADRIQTHVADLDESWPSVAPGSTDLVWAGLSLHHVADPAGVLERAFAALQPGGVLVVTELGDAPRYAPSDLGTEREGLQDRLDRAAADQGPPAAADWSARLTAAGFEGIDRSEIDFHAATDTPEGRGYLTAQLSSWTQHFSDYLGDADIAALRAATAAVQNGTSDLTVSTGRTVWTARRPAADGTAGDALEADVVVIGGGAAGLAAAVALARSRRGVVVVDAGEPRNAPAEGIHNALGNEGISPLELVRQGRVEAEGYGAKIVKGQATGASGTVDDFTIAIDGGTQRVHARRVILATGLVDDLPDVPGVHEAWGHTVLHCPFCHGWEIRDQRIAILTRDDIAVHHALLFRELSEHVALFLHEAAGPTGEQQDQLDALGVPVVQGRVERLVIDGTNVRQIQIEGGERFDVDAVVVAPRYHARTELFEALGGEATATPWGRQISTDPRGTTAVPGVWAAGNANEPMAMLVASTASGVTAGSAVHGDLAFADLQHTVHKRKLSA